MNLRKLVAGISLVSMLTGCVGNQDFSRLRDYESQNYRGSPKFMECPSNVMPQYCHKR